MGSEKLRGVLVSGVGFVVVCEFWWVFGEGVACVSFRYCHTIFLCESAERESEGGGGAA